MLSTADTNPPTDHLFNQQQRKLIDMSSSRPGSSSRGSRAGRSSRPQSTAILIAKMIQEEAERKYLQKHATQIKNATASEKHRLRCEARQKGKEAYAAALEKSIRTTEAEKQSLRGLFEMYQNNRKQLIAQLRRYGYNFS